MKTELAIIVCLVLIFSVLYIANLSTMPEEKIIQHAVVAGQWYPADADGLRSAVEGYMNASEKKDLNGTVMAIIVPHAGYEYSGKIAGAAFRQIGSYDNIFLIGPSHYYPIDGLIAMNATAYETPLGEMSISPIEKQLLSDGAKYMPEAFEKEHSLEAQIPFLQATENKSSLVLMLTGSTDNTILKNVLEKYSGNRDLIIVSADLSHYHPETIAKQLDEYTINSIMNIDSFRIMSAEIDAPAAVAALLQIAKERQWKPVLLKYGNSGDVSGNKSSVVSYAAFAFLQDWSVIKDDQAFLLNLSRSTLQNYVSNKISTTIEENSVPPKLLESKGCFVTLNENGELRGCIGHLEAQEPLYKCVIDNTINAAARDTRFSPVISEEVSNITIEISVLTNPEPAGSIGTGLMDMLTTKDGVILKQFGKESTYLPQVWSQIPGKQEFLSSLCQKGGMDALCWNSTQTQAFIYKDFAFSEEKNSVEILNQSAI